MCFSESAGTTTEITAVDKAFEMLKATREQAVTRFKADSGGVCLTVHEKKLKEIEAAILQWG